MISLIYWVAECPWRFGAAHLRYISVRASLALYFSRPRIYIHRPAFPLARSTLTHYSGGDSAKTWGITQSPGACQQVVPMRRFQERIFLPLLAADLYVVDTRIYCKLVVKTNWLYTY